MKITDRFLKEGASFVILSNKNSLFAQNKFLAMKFNPFLGGHFERIASGKKNPSKEISSKI